jgi:hypothetical protein
MNGCNGDRFSLHVLAWLPFYSYTKIVQEGNAVKAPYVKKFGIGQVLGVGKEFYMVI